MLGLAHVVRTLETYTPVWHRVNQSRRKNIDVLVARMKGNCRQPNSSMPPFAPQSTYFSRYEPQGGLVVGAQGIILCCVNVGRHRSRVIASPTRKPCSWTPLPPSNPVSPGECEKSRACSRHSVHRRHAPVFEQTATCRAALFLDWSECSKGSNRPLKTMYDGLRSCIRGTRAPWHSNPFIMHTFVSLLVSATLAPFATSSKAHHSQRRFDEPVLRV